MTVTWFIVVYCIKKINIRSNGYRVKNLFENISWLSGIRSIRSHWKTHSMSSYAPNLIWILFCNKKNRKKFLKLNSRFDNRLLIWRRIKVSVWCGLTVLFALQTVLPKTSSVTYRLISAFFQPSFINCIFWIIFSLASSFTSLTRREMRSPSN